MKQNADQRARLSGSLHFSWSPLSSAAATARAQDPLLAGRRQSRHHRPRSRTRQRPHVRPGPRPQARRNHPRPRRGRCRRHRRNRPHQKRLPPYGSEPPRKELHIPPSNLLVNASHSPRPRLPRRRRPHDPGDRGSEQEPRPGDGRRRLRPRRPHLRKPPPQTQKRPRSGRPPRLRPPPDEEVAAVGPIDPQIGLIRFNGEDGRTVAVLYNFACHPIMGVPGAANTADITGFSSRVIEDNLNEGKGAPAPSPSSSRAAAATSTLSTTRRSTTPATPNRSATSSASAPFKACGPSRRSQTPPDRPQRNPHPPAGRPGRTDRRPGSGTAATPPVPQGNQPQPQDLPPRWRSSTTSPRSSRPTPPAPISDDATSAVTTSPSSTRRTAATSSLPSRTSSRWRS